MSWIPSSLEPTLASLHTGTYKRVILQNANVQFGFKGKMHFINAVIARVQFEGKEMAGSP